MPAYIPIDDDYMLMADEEAIKAQMSLLDRRADWIRNNLIKELQILMNAAKRKGMMTIAGELYDAIEQNSLRLTKMDGIKARYHADIVALRESPYATAGMRARRGKVITGIKPKTMIDRAVGRVGGRVPRFP